MQVKEVREKVIDVLRSYVGRKVEITGNKLIGRDIGMEGGDSIQFQEEIEEMFGVDLVPLVNAHAVTPQPGWFDRLLGQNRRAYSDITVDELVEYLASNSKC